MDDNRKQFIADFRAAYKSGNYNSQEFIDRASKLCETRKEALMLIYDCITQTDSVHRELSGTVVDLTIDDEIEHQYQEARQELIDLGLDPDNLPDWAKP